MSCQMYVTRRLLRSTIPGDSSEAPLEDDAAESPGRRLHSTSSRNRNDTGKKKRIAAQTKARAASATSKRSKARNAELSESPARSSVAALKSKKRDRSRNKNVAIESSGGDMVPRGHKRKKMQGVTECVYVSVHDPVDEGSDESEGDDDGDTEVERGDTMVDNDGDQEKEEGIQLYDGIGLLVDALDGKWCEAKILDLNAGKRMAFLHYIGWNSRYDRWLNLESLAAHGSHTGEQLERPVGSF
ncbi:TPA: hypothetical protein N0F65_009553 [Lagenidium giganteum]|uniref:Tudor-knot domain-containing protein n=1 Tax=Lagenidium giganteum TaxID=4803 RepID=A0AAV2YSE5_9STRA|nr:TPA: hypothetical protein N0F65_009553 [Lagenidium giganteum]